MLLIEIECIINSAGLCLLKDDCFWKSSRFVYIFYISVKYNITHLHSNKPSSFGIPPSDVL